MGRKNTTMCSADWSLANGSFINMFSHIKVYHLTCFGSDHAVIRIGLEADPEGGMKRMKHNFQVLRSMEQGYYI